MTHKKKVPTLVPYLTAKDLQKSVSFYEKAFGFHLESSNEDDAGKLVHAEMFFSDSLLLFGAEGGYGSDKLAPATTKAAIPMSLWLYCDNVDAQYEKAVKEGAVSLMEPNDAFWGARVCMVKDIDGYEWGFCKDL